MLDGMRSDTSPLARTNQSSAARHSRRRAIALLAVAAITSVAACGDSEPAADAGSITTAGELDATSTTPAAAAEATSTTATATAVTLPVGEVAVHRDLAYGTVEPGNLFDLYVPDVAGESLLPLIIWHSGSGWFENDAKDRVDDRAEVVEELTQRGFAVASINVRSSADACFRLRVSTLVLLSDTYGRMRQRTASTPTDLRSWAIHQAGGRLRSQR